MIFEPVEEEVSYPPAKVYEASTYLRALVRLWITELTWN